MLCFKVSVNGRLACIAGKESNGSLTVTIRQSEKEMPHVIVGGKENRYSSRPEKTYVFGTQNLELNDSVTVELAEVEEPDQPIEIHTEELRSRLGILGGLLSTYTWDNLSALLHERKPIKLKPRELRTEDLAAYGRKPAQGSSNGPASHIDDEATASTDADSSDRKIEGQETDETTGDRRLSSKSKHLHLVPPKPKYRTHCLFCGKTQREVAQLILGPNVSICDECVDLCQEIIADKVEKEDQAADEAATFKLGLWPRN